LQKFQQAVGLLDNRWRAAGARSSVGRLVV